ncbi:PH domain-containing protein [Alteribacter natronophilus]|uniref:PH domain-containing protein n=1 Tax=Alteribacter natronophilus TaxID=2583810 RepID=UPI00110E52BF|nr:PH domain-containing protein [Alteribacter natronophilus]TMW73008.1 hypothetical protein FGB90_01485 [Alteribacter natronophilus]
MKFDIHKPAWVMILVAASFLLIIGLLFFTDDREARLIIGIVLLVDLPLLIFFCGVFFRGYHRIEGSVLTVYYGVLKWEISLEDVRSAEIIQNRWYHSTWPPAFKSRQIRITYGRFGTLDITSPDEEDLFMKEILKYTEEEPDRTML